jgi:hypothetical protein
LPSPSQTSQTIGQVLRTSFRLLQIFKIFRIFLAQLHKSKKRASSTSLPDIDVPKLVKNNWKTFNLSRVRGMNTIPINYVVWSTQVGDYNGAYESTEEQLLSCINLRGSNFNSDKQSVCSLLIQCTKGSDAESINEKYAAFRDGRKAFHAVKAHMESTVYMNNLRTKAMAKIQAAHYKPRVN